MNYEVIGSSSQGNCIIVEDVLMLDCGLSYSKIKTHLSKVKLIFISHIHQDHLLPSTIKKIAYNYPTIKFLTGSIYVVKELVNCGIKPQNVYIIGINRKYDLGILKVELNELYHDTPNFALKWEMNGKKGIYIVDTCKVEHIEAKNYDLYLIENNYQKDLLQQHIDNCEDDNRLYYLYRVPKTHLSSEQANSFLIENMGENSVYEYIHQSNYNYKEVD